MQLQQMVYQEDEFELEVDNTLIYFNNNQNLLFVKGLKQEAKQATLYNAFGQQVFNSTSVTKTN